MTERKRRILKVVPALLGMLASSFLLMPINNNVRAGLMGICIGVSVVALVKLGRAQPC